MDVTEEHPLFLLKDIIAVDTTQEIITEEDPEMPTGIIEMTDIMMTATKGGEIGDMMTEEIGETKREVTEEIDFSRDLEEMGKGEIIPLPRATRKRGIRETSEGAQGSPQRGSERHSELKIIIGY